MELQTNFRAALGIPLGKQSTLINADTEVPASGAVGSFWEKLADVYYTIPDQDPRKQAIFRLERQIVKKREEKQELKDSS